MVGSGPPVVKLAGIAGGVGLYREEVEAVARSGHQVAMVDLAGDRRDDPADDRLSWSFLSREVEAGFDELGLARALLWGTSFGALVALAHAARHPQCVSGLVLSLPPDPLHRPRLWKALHRWATRRPNADLAVRLTFLAGFGLLTSWEGMWPTALRRAPRLARSSIEARTPARTVREKIDLLWAEEPGLPHPGTPTAIVAAAWDPVAPLPGARRWQSRIPGSTLHIVPRAGHAAPATRPACYAGAVVEAIRVVNAARSEPGDPTRSQ